MLAGIWVEIVKHTFSLDNFKIYKYVTKEENNSSSGSVRLCFCFCECSRIAWGFRLASHVSFSRISNSFGAFSCLTLLSQPKLPFFPT